MTIYKSISNDSLHTLQNALESLNELAQLTPIDDFTYHLIRTVNRDLQAAYGAVIQSGSDFCTDTATADE